MNQANNSAATYQPIEDFAIIGDLHTVALVGKNGSRMMSWVAFDRALRIVRHRGLHAPMVKSGTTLNTYQNLYS